MVRQGIAAYECAAKSRFTYTFNVGAMFFDGNGSKSKTVQVTAEILRLTKPRLGLIQLAELPMPIQDLLRRSDFAYYPGPTPKHRPSR